MEPESHDSEKKEPPAPAGGSFLLRRWILGLFGVAMVAAFVLTRPAGDPMLPDLGFAPPDELYVARTEDGHLQLLLSAMIVNIGEGPLLIDARLDRDQTDWEIRQLVARSTRGTDDLGVVAQVRYGGDGHDHLHIEDAARYTLTRGDEVVAVDQKVGFCFFDQNQYQLDLTEAPQSPIHVSAACGGAAATAFEMGLSVGWGDRYIWSLPGQSLPLDGVTDGEYRLVLTADPDDMFRETRETNNAAWATIRLDGLGGDFPSVEVLDSGADH